MGGILTGIGTGAAFGLLNGSRRTAISSIMALSSEYSLALAGVKVDTIGEQHVWEQRPAVFVFNHQSQLDVFVICHLLRRDFTGVAKQELTKDPIFGPLFRFAGVAFVDRKSGGNPRDALAPAVAKLQVGISVVIAPEGTRSLTPTLGEFKTGAFHLAREAGVPVVPDGDPERRRADVARLPDHQARHRPGRRPAAHRRLGLAGRPGPQQDPRGPGALRGHPRALAGRAPPGPQGASAAGEEAGRREEGAGEEAVAKKTVTRKDSPRKRST